MLMKSLKILKYFLPSTGKWDNYYQIFVVYRAAQFPTKDFIRHR